MRRTTYLIHHQHNPENHLGSHSYGVGYLHVVYMIGLLKYLKFRFSSKSSIKHSEYISVVKMNLPQHDKLIIAVFIAIIGISTYLLM